MDCVNHTGQPVHEGRDEGDVGNEEDPQRARHGRKVGVAGDQR